MPDFVKKEGAPTGDFRSDNNFLLGYFEEKDHSLYYRYDAERVIIDPWGDNSFRVRASKMSEMPEELWALDGKPENRSSEITIKEYSAEIVNGKIKAVIKVIGFVVFSSYLVSLKENVAYLLIGIFSLVYLLYQFYLSGLETK